MEKLKLTKDKMKALVQVIHFLITRLENDKHDLKEWPRILCNAHLFVFRTLSQKLRKKLITLENHPGTKPVTYEIDPIQAAVLMAHQEKITAGASGMDSYSYGVFVEISGPIFKKLLS